MKKRMYRLLLGMLLCLFLTGCSEAIMEVEKDALSQENSIDFKPLEGGYLNYSMDDMKALEIGSVERFADFSADTIEEQRTFVESWANEEEFWNIPKKEGTEQDLSPYYMNRSYETYKHIILMDSIEPNNHRVDFEAYGFY